MPASSANARAAVPIGGDVVRDSVAICIATYRRPGMLEQLLDSLGKLRVRQEIVREVVVFVVDNDAGESGRGVVTAARSSLPWALHYLVEPQRNISLARNRGVAAALAAGADQVAFVDDDETVSPEWLEELLVASRRFSADAVFGPVLPRFEEGVRPWVREGGFFAPHVHPDGAVIGYGATSNALVSARLLRAADGPFDPRFGISGGGDAHLFLRAVLGGARLIWADGAAVTESIPLSRARPGWIISRSFRIGYAYVRCRRDLLPIWRWLPMSIGAALARIVVGLALTVVTLPRGRAAAVRALRKVAHGAGAIAAIAGVRYDEYQEVHGH